MKGGISGAYLEGARNGLDPLDLAALVMRAIEEREFYIFTEPGRRASVQARIDTVMAGFDAVDERLPGILNGKAILNG